MDAAGSFRLMRNCQGLLEFDCFRLLLLQPLNQYIDLFRWNSDTAIFAHVDMGNAYFTIFAKVDFDGFVESSHRARVFGSSAFPLTSAVLSGNRGGRQRYATVPKMSTGFEFWDPRG